MKNRMTREGKQKLIANYLDTFNKAMAQALRNGKPTERLIEDLQDFMNKVMAVEEVEEQECIFEKRKCIYAKSENGVFECKAPSDEEMTCI